MRQQLGAPPTFAPKAEEPQPITRPSSLDIL
jgi:hypothetical protein